MNVKGAAHDLVNFLGYNPVFNGEYGVHKYINKVEHLINLNEGLKSLFVSFLKISIVKFLLHDGRREETTISCLQQTDHDHVEPLML